MLPHGWCILWDAYLLIAHVSSDVVIALAYYAIPLILFRTLVTLENRLGRHVLLAFALFIIACGTTHIFEIVVIWRPWYWAQAIVKTITALLSIVTAVALTRITYLVKVGRL